MSFRYLTGLIIVLILLMAVSASFAETINYSYDDMFRLIKAEYEDGTVVEYVYDNLGNRLVKTTSLLGSPANNPPYTPFNPFPADASIDIDTNADLSWTGGDPDADDNVVYYVYLGTSTPLPLVSSNFQPGFDPGRLEVLTTYYWKVVTRDNHNAKVESPVWSFTTKNDPPSMPGNISPGNGVTVISNSVDLSWSSSSDPNPGDTITYDIYFGASSPPPLVESGYSGTNYQVTNLTKYTTYYWNIVAKDNHGAISSGEEWSFISIPVTYVSGTISSDTTWTYANSPYIVDGNISVNTGVTLTIEPGVVLKFKQNNILTVNGTLNAIGTATEPIYFTDLRDDSIGGDTNGDGSATSPAKGWWKGISVESGGTATLDYTVVKYGGCNCNFSSYSNVYKTGSGNLTITNSTISDSLLDGIKLSSVTGTITISSNTILNNATGINVDSTSGGTFQGNIIMGNTSYGIYHTGNNVINAIYNYWGDSSGPLDSSDDRATGGLYNPNGIGNRVSDKVNYYPWTFAYTDMDNDGILDDGDYTGIAGDNPCTGGNTANCDDNCWLTPNPDQADIDSDGIGSTCDNCPSSPNTEQLDTDGDGIGNSCDNCPTVPNPDQLDTDNDGLSNACDSDDDNDGWSDEIEIAAGTDPLDSSSVTV